MKLGVLFLFLGTCVTTGLGVDFFQRGRPSFRGTGSGMRSPSSIFPSYGQKMKMQRNISPFPVLQGRIPSFRYSRYGQGQRTIPTRSFQPMRRVYGEAPSYRRPSMRRPMFRIRQGSAPTLPYRGNGRIISQRVISPEYAQKLIGSQRRAHRVPSFGRGIPRGVLSGRRIRLQQPSRRPSLPRARDEVIALFAVDDARKQGARIGSKGVPHIAPPQLAATIDKGVKAEKVVDATVEKKVETVKKIEVTKETEHAIVKPDSVIKKHDADATIAVNDADTVNITVESAPVGKLAPTEPIKDALVKDVVQKTVTETKADVVIEESPVLVQKQAIQEEQTVVIPKHDILKVKPAEIPIKR